MKSVYFHGNPGSPAELELLGGDAVRTWFAPDRTSLPLDPEARIARLTQLVTKFSGTLPVQLVGFSAGAQAAMQVAARMPGADLTLHLVSPAGPLETGDFLESMAGAPVFRIARDNHRLFSGLVKAQSLCARWAPGVLAYALFRSAQGEDKALAAHRDFRLGFRKVLRSCLVEGRASYAAEIASYVLPWAGLLTQIRHPVTIWQGTRDNWTPPAMAESLAERLPHVQAVHLLPGLSHFTTLQAALKALTQG